MSVPQEERLREALRHRVEDVYADVDTAPRAIVVGQRLRHRRWGAAAALLVAVAMGAISWASPWLPQSPTATSTTPTAPTLSAPSNPGDARESLAGWLSGLPEGAPPTLPYLQGDVFHDGSSQWSLRSSPYSVLGAVPGGWLVQQMKPHYTFRYGIKEATGGVVWLTRPLFDPLEVVSSDYQRLAVVADHQVLLYDLSTQAQIAQFDARTYVEPVELTNAGLVYETGNGHAYVWSPGASPERLSFSPNAASDDLRYALVLKPGKPCAKGVGINGSLVPRTVYSGCRENRPYSLSPDGRHALTVNLGVVDMSDGSLTPLPGFPGSRGWPTIAWEDNENALVRVETDSSPSHPGTVALVRCSVITRSCERLLQTASRKAGYAYYSLFILDPTTTP